VALSGAGEVLIVEVKSSLADYRADGKWRDYLPYCDGFAFAVGPDFPCGVLPESAGLLVTDGWQAAMHRPFAGDRLHPSRRKAMTLRFALTAARRLAAQEAVVPGH